MPGSTTFAAIKFAEGADEVNKFPAEVSSPGAKTIDKYLEEHTLTIKKYAGGATLKSGELAQQEKSGETFTLPLAATANQLIGVFCGTGAGTSCKVTTSGGATIFGDYIGGEATITLTNNQHVLLFSNGTSWFIVAGEAKREQAYITKAFTKVEAETSFEVSATRPAFTILRGVSETGTIFIGGIEVGIVGTVSSLGVFVPPGQKVKVAAAVNTASVLL